MVHTYKPNPVYEKRDVTVLYNPAAHTHTNTHTEDTENRPNMKTKNKKQKTCTPIDVAIPAK
jgi:hypothetical protein